MPWPDQLTYRALGRKFIDPILLPKGTEEYAEDITFFVGLMLEKLHKHRHKGHWDRINIKEALIQLEEEVVELKEAIRLGDSYETYREAADVANFAMIIASVLRRRDPRFRQQAQLELNYTNE